MRRTRADSIPENSTAMANASMEELLMRHSSPILHSSTGRAVASPLAERNSSPSPLRLNRPRSNPRTRTPMRAEEDQDEQEGPRRITIRPMTGAAVGTDMASSYTARHVSWSSSFYISASLASEHCLVTYRYTLYHIFTSHFCLRACNTS